MAFPDYNGLVGRWSLNNVLTDSSDLKNNLTAHDTPSYVTGNIGNALSYNGTSQYCKVGTADIINSNGDFSVSAWVNIDNILANQYSVCGISVQSSNYWYLMHRADKGGLVLRYNTGPGALFSASPSKNLVAGVWSHVVLVRNHTAHTLTVYQDNSVIISDATDPTFTASGFVFHVGSRGDSDQLWKGSLQRVRLFSRAVIAADVNALYNYGVGN
jgi:hypothetical protein